jgi:hypothetical protein
LNYAFKVSDDALDDEKGHRDDRSSLWNDAFDNAQLLALPALLLRPEGHQLRNQSRRPIS